MQTNLKPANPPVHITALTLASRVYKRELSINSKVPENLLNLWSKISLTLALKSMS